MTQSSVLKVKDLSFRYRDRDEFSLKDFTFEVAQGELLLVAGASGSGKTTFIRCVNGLIPRSYKGELKGLVQLQGQAIADFSLARISQIVGTVLQDPERQILGSRVRNEVAFGLENLGLPRSEIVQRVNEALEYLRITELRDRETFNLSGGEKQKVALAGVLAMNPKIVLLDEPLASLDPASAQETLKLVRRMVDEGMSVVMVEHRVEDVMKINPDRVLFIEQGDMRYLGPVSGLKDVVDYHEIKMPAPIILERAAKEPPLPELSILPGVARRSGRETSALVDFKYVTFYYERDQPVLRDINLSIYHGDVIAVLGPNGAVKTTLVKHAIGLLKPKEGQVLVNQKDTRQMSIAQIANTLGYVFQSPSHMLFAPTVHDELAFGPTNLNHKPEVIEQEVQKAIDIVNLSGREQDPPLALSFGQQKRVSIAAILAMQSKILIMDEPTAGQDYQNYMSFMDSILQLPSFEAILFITHDIDLAVIYANRILLMDKGAIILDGPPQDVLKDEDLLIKHRLVPTSLLKANLEHYSETGQFMRAESLAHHVA